MRKILLAALLMAGTAANAQYVFKEYNINGVGDSYPHSMIVMNGILYFIATAGGEGTEIFYTNGIHPSIGIVSDILPGSGSSNPDNLTLLNSSKLIFSADDGTGKGIEVWQSDGTSAGTSLLKDIYAGGVSSTPGNFIAYNGRVYFSAFGSGGGNQDFWVTNGTPTGTALLKDINPTGGSYPEKYCEANGKLFFTATTDLEGAEIWVSNGTDTGTILLKDIQAGILGSMPQSKIALGNKLLFQVIGPPPAGGYIYETDGTPAGTKLFGKTGLNNINDRFNVYFNGKYYFAGGVMSADELMVSDGTVAGTQSLGNIGNSGYPVVFNNKIYFMGTEPTSGTELWVSDGTVAGTNIAADILPGTLGSNPSNLKVYKNKLYFTAAINLNDTQLFVSDGTDTGTHILAPTVATNSNPLGVNIFKGFTEMDGKLYFAANYTGNGAELWSLEDTTKPVSVKNVASAAAISIYPNPATEVCNVVMNNAVIQNGNIQLCDMKGSVLQQQELSAGQKQATIQLVNIAAGVYTIKADIDGNIVNRKLVVQ